MLTVGDCTMVKLEDIGIITKVPRSKGSRGIKKDPNGKAETRMHVTIVNEGIYSHPIQTTCNHSGARGEERLIPEDQGLTSSEDFGIAGFDGMPFAASSFCQTSATHSPNDKIDNPHMTHH